MKLKIIDIPVKNYEITEMKSVEIKFKEEIVPKISKLKVDLQAITLILEQLKDAIEQKG